MRVMLSWNGRVAAAASFYGLVALGSGLLAGLGGLVLYQLPLFEACRSIWDTVVAPRPAYGIWLPAFIAGGSLVLMGVALARQWVATRRLLGWLVAQRVAIPPRLVRLADEAGLGGRIDCVSGTLITPFCYGFLRPRVCVSLELLDLLDDGELAAVLRHEAHHVSSREPLKIWISRALAHGLFFLPLARDLRDSYLTAKELAADEMTTAGGRDELPLASALIKMLSLEGRIEANPAAPIGGLLNTPVALVAQGATGSVTEARLRRLLDRQPVRPRLPSATSVALSLLVVVAIFAISYTGRAVAARIPYDECAAQTVHLSAVPPVRPLEPLATQPVLPTTSLPVSGPVGPPGREPEDCDSGPDLGCPRQPIMDLRLPLSH